MGCGSSCGTCVLVSKQGRYQLYRQTGYNDTVAVKLFVFDSLNDIRKTRTSVSHMSITSGTHWPTTRPQLQPLLLIMIHNRRQGVINHRHPHQPNKPSHQPFITWISAAVSMRTGSEKRAQTHVDCEHNDLVLVCLIREREYGASHHFFQALLLSLSLLSVTMWCSCGWGF